MKTLESTPNEPLDNTCWIRLSIRLRLNLVAMIIRFGLHINTFKKLFRLIIYELCDDIRLVDCRGRAV